MPDNIDDIDRQLLNRIQSDFPITARPFEAIGQELGLAEPEVVARISRLKQSGYIRRIGGNFVPEKLGYVSTLCAAKVPPDQIDRFAETVNRYPGVTHNYLRENDYNVWFTFIAPSREDIANHLADIARITGVHEILNLPASHVFKIRAKFKVK
jgi:DNA-binding Lrp family transcriptional regulator